MAPERKTSMKINRPELSTKRTEISAFCERHYIKKLSFFGSVLRSDFNEVSDVDVLVEFDSGHVPGLIRFASIELELSEIIGRKVDLRTPQDLSRYFRDQVLATASVQYAR